MKTFYKTMILILSIFFFFTNILNANEMSIYEKKELKTFKSLKYISDEVIVKFKDGVTQDKIDKLNNKYGTKVIAKSKYKKFTRLQVPKGKTVFSLVKLYSLNKDVVYAEPNYIATALYTPNPNDTYFDPFQWNLMDNNSQYDSGINMNSAWDITSGDSNIIVAVVDSGVAYKNKGKRYKKAPDLANTNFVDQSLMYDFINNDTEPLDDEGHGTHVTGTIAQSTNNNLGVAGIAYETTIMPIKVLDSNGSGSYSAIAEGIMFAADKGARVINLSLGGPSSSSTLKDAVDYAYYTKGVLLTCAAGNDYENGNPISYPAYYDECFTVGATRYDGTRAYYSNTGSYVDIAAPGGDVTVDQNGDGYGDGILQQTFDKRPNDFGYYFYQGTSMATPHVSAVAALLLAENPTLTPMEIREAIEQSAKDLGIAGKDSLYGWGLLDANAALNYNLPSLDPDLQITEMTLMETVTIGDMNSVEVTVRKIGDLASTVEITLDDISDETYSIDGVKVLNFTSNENEKKVTFDWDTSSSSIGTHELIATLSANVALNSDTSNDSLSKFSIVEDTVIVSEIYINDISMNYRQQGKRYVGLADVLVKSDSGIKANASVHVTWKLNDEEIATQTQITDSSGIAKFTTPKYRLNPASGNTFTIEIDNIILNNYIYDESKNIETTDSITIP